LNEIATHAFNSTFTRTEYVTGGEIAKSRFDLVYNPFYFAALSRKKIGLGSKKKSYQAASRFILGHSGIGRKRG